MDFQWNTRYEIPDSRTPAEFVSELVNGHLAPVTIRLETRDGATIEGTFEKVTADAVQIEVDAVREELRSVPCELINAATLVDTEGGPLDRSDELRPNEF